MSFSFILFIIVHAKRYKLMPDFVKALNDTQLLKLNSFKGRKFWFCFNFVSLANVIGADISLNISSIKLTSTMFVI
jgi:hypothetical protein